MRLLGRRVLSRLEEAQMFAAGVEIARLRRENQVLLDDIGDLRMLYAMSLHDRDRQQELFDKSTGTREPWHTGTSVLRDQMTGVP
jgi:hypothetical protein